MIHLKHKHLTITIGVACALLGLAIVFRARSVGGSGVAETSANFRDISAHERKAHAKYGKGVEDTGSEAKATSPQPR
jgi:hypothetical protein